MQMKDLRAFFFFFSFSWLLIILGLKLDRCVDFFCFVFFSFKWRESVSVYVKTQFPSLRINSL
jgi:hypothetical protein